MPLLVGPQVTVETSLADLIKSRRVKRDLKDLYYESSPGVRLPLPIDPVTNVPEGFELIDRASSTCHRDPLGHCLMMVIRDVVEEPYLVSDTA